MNNFLKLFFRNLVKQARLSFLTILTLVLGFVTSFFVLNYVSYELSYDKELGTDLFRVNLKTKKNDEVISRSARTSPPVGKLLADELPEVSGFSRLVLMGEVILKQEDKTIREKDVLLADREHFDQFMYTWIQGSAEDMMKPGYIAVSETLARRLAGHTDIAGTEVQINSPNFEGTYPFLISGVYKDRPENSHLRPNLHISYRTLHRFVGNDIDQAWNWNNLFTYVTARGDDMELSEQATRAFLKSRDSDLQARGISAELVFQPVRNIHTEQGNTGEFVNSIDKDQILYIGLLSIFILAMTYTNFLNLFLVRTVERRREMAVRTVLGSSGNGILRITFGDILVLHLISTMLALTLIQLLGPAVTNIFNLPASILPGTLNQLVILSLLAAVGIGLSYVFTYFKFSREKWVKNLSGGRTTASLNDIRWYSYLLGTQMTIAVFFIAGAVVVYHQLQKISNHDPGIDLENKVIVKAPLMGIQENAVSFKETLWNELSMIPGIENLVMMNEVPGRELYWRMDNVGLRPNEPSAVNFAWLAVSDGYMDFFDIPVLAGREFDRSKDTWNSSIVLNETGMRMMGFTNPEEAVGKDIFLGDHPIRVIGIVGDFLQENLRTGVEPQFFRYGANGLNYFALHVSDVNMEMVETAYRKVFAEAPFDYFVLTNDYEKQYAGENLMARVVLSMAVIALFIATCGIIGISLQILERRSKELVIKKIHGASGVELWRDVASSFYKIGLFALLAGFPLAYYIFDKWLGQFINAEFPLIYFLMIPIIILGITLFLSITMQILRTIGKNPREILVSE